LAGSGGCFGTFLFALIFLMAGANHFNRQTIGHAASQGVPLAAIAVPLSGVVAIAGGLSILLGYRANLGAWLIVLFLVPVSLMMHKFWTLTDPMMAQIQMIMFMKNVAMLGSALLISQFGAGPWSLDTRRTRSLSILINSRGERNMVTLLHINVSPRGNYSFSRQLGNAAVQAWKERNPGGRVIERDLAKTALTLSTSTGLRVVLASRTPQ
jgi:putative oxidoreductase